MKTKILIVGKQGVGDQLVNMISKNLNIPVIGNFQLLN